MLGLTRRKRANLLQMTPILKEHVRLHTTGDKHLLLIPRTSWLERFSIRYMQQPKMIQIELDPLGNTVLQCCTGAHTVSEIAEILVNRFGQEAEPVIPRLVKFLQTVEFNGWLNWQHEQYEKQTELLQQ
ncbi:PqqD family protein [Brevibacillus fulvus]|uniref:Coenzyme PQQ synthesis protein D (PqqD) n=1 Tax=Brevibacillus fulvus TaxID=1125967 RepID=A0A938Y254_9BACL|nr:PqqD family protein [Brevibacillus fulvus]MBM7590247.1 hypothetical protein [Brevibacillus fulvus]